MIIKHLFVVLKILLLGFAIIGCDIVIQDQSSDKKNREKPAKPSQDDGSNSTQNDDLSKKEASPNNDDPKRTATGSAAGTPSGENSHSTPEGTFRQELPSIVSNLAGDYESHYEVENRTSEDQEPAGVEQFCTESHEDFSMKNDPSSITMELTKKLSCSKAQLEKYNENPIFDDTDRYESYSSILHGRFQMSSPNCNLADIPTFSSLEEWEESAEMENLNECVDQLDRFKHLLDFQVEVEYKTLKGVAVKQDVTVAKLNSGEPCEIERTGLDSILIKNCTHTFSIKQSYSEPKNERLPTSIFAIESEYVLSMAKFRKSQDRYGTHRLTGGTIKIKYNEWEGSVMFKEGRARYDFKNKKDDNRILGNLYDSLDKPEGPSSSGERTPAPVSSDD